MFERKTVIHNISNLSPKLYSICYIITGEKLLAEKLLSECLSVLSLKTKGRALGHLSIHKSQLFKQSLETLTVLLKKREFAMGTNSSGFYQLPIFQRYVLILKYRLGFQSHELTQICSLSDKELEDCIFKAKNFLNNHGSLELETL
jgi:hypothetical protein